MPIEFGSLSNMEGLRKVFRKASQNLRAPERLTVSEWADRYRHIGQANATPGPWRTDNAPYQRGPMDCIGDRVTRRITLMWAAQTGKTEVINNGIGYAIAQEPKSCMMMQPTQSDLKTWTETKLTPLLRDTPVIRDKVAKPRGRDGVNNSLMKSYPGGFLMFSWSGSTNTMRGRSAPVINCDEIDGYTMTEEGDPVQLLWQRAATFGDRRKLLETSTPTIKGFSRVEKSYLAGDRRKYWVPCPHCNNYITFQFAYFKWDSDADGTARPDTAYYICEHCGCTIEDKHKPAMLKAGEWRAERPFMGHASFHLNEFYSPWRKWRDIAQSFLDKKHAGDVQSFVNVSLAETWEEQGETIDDTGLMQRREEYGAAVPVGAYILTAGIDTQPDRLEVEVVAWGHGEESWSVETAILYGDPDQSEVWEALDDFLDRRWTNTDGVELSISCSCIDSGGANTQAVYGYCKKRKGQRVFAIKGKGGDGVPIVSAPTKRKTGRRSGRPVELFTIGTDQAKTLLYKRLALPGSGPGRCHWPAHYEEEYFRQLTAEKCVTRYVKGWPKREWLKVRPRNEALDCRVYAHAALLILNPNFARFEKRLAKQAATMPDDPETMPETAKSAEEVPEEMGQKRKKVKLRSRKKRRESFVMG
jgi:phage terminase large subunit GpA-like protein